MKIAHINMFYLPTFGGVEKVMQELAERQVKQGHEVHVFCCDSDKYQRIEKKEEIINGVHVHRYHYWFRLSLSTYIWPSLLWKLPKYDFDIIHSHVSGHAYILIAGLISKIKGARHIHTTHCPWTNAFRSLKVKIPLFFTYLIFNKLAFYLTDKIVAITPWEIDSYLTKWTKKDKIITIPNGVNEILFKKVKPNNLKKKYKIKGKLVLFFGRLNITKGPDKFVLAAEEILKERKDIYFMIIGPDEGMKKRVEELIRNNRKIILKGPIRDKRKIAEMYQAADVYVLPSFREGLPLTLFEAMASGLPIVASPVNGIPYEMKDNINGYFVEYGDIKGLKEKILKILDNKAISKRFSRNNKEKAKNYSWNKISKRYLKVYEKCISYKKKMEKIN